MAITTPSDEVAQTVAVLPGGRKTAGQVRPASPAPAVLPPEAPSIFHRTTIGRVMSPEDQRRYEANIYPNTYPVDNYALTRNTDRSRDYAIACSDDGFSYAHARYNSILHSNLVALDAFPGIRNAVEFISQSRTHSFRDVFADAIDSRGTYYSNDYRGDIPQEAVAEMCRVTGYSAHLNARIIYETVKIYDEFLQRMHSHSDEVAKSKTLKASHMNTTANTPINTTTSSDAAKPSEEVIVATATASDAVQAAAENARVAASEASAGRAAALRARFPNTATILERSKVAAVKSATVVAKGAVVTSTAIVIGELGLFTYRSMRGQDYTIGDGLRGVAGLFARRVVTPTE